jgi:prepilin peptidase CpaA
MNVANVAMVMWIGTVLAAAFSDWKSFRIPNYMPAILVLLFLVMQAFGGFTPIVWDNYLHFGIALLGGMLMFGLGWLGGGDAKLYAAIALWLPMGNAILLLLATVFAGLLLAVAYLITRKTRRIKRVAIQSMDAKKESRIPYGVAIVSGAIITASTVGWSNMFKIA